MNFALVETSQVFARCCAEAKPEWLMSVAPQLCTPIYDQAMYNAQSGFVSARERLTCGRLLIHPGRRCHYGAVNPAEARDIFIKDASIGLDNWTERLRFCELGAGNANEPWEEAGKLLKKLGYDGWVFIEHDTHLQDPMIDLKVSIDHLKRIFL